MKLNKTHREAFVRAVMADVPTVDYDQLIRDVALKAAVDQLPPDVRKVWDNPDLRAYVNTRYIYAVGFKGVAIPAQGGDEFEFTEAAKAELKDLDAKQSAQETHLDELEAKLRAAIYSCSTRKQLAELLPEMEKYLPPEGSATRNLPAVANLVSDLMQAGWPK